MGFSFVIFRKLCGIVILEQGDWREQREREDLEDWRERGVEGRWRF